MADSDEMKSADAEHDSGDDGVSALRWTARRLEATDDDDVLGQEQVEEEYRWSSDDLLDDDKCEGGVTGEKLEEEYRWSSDDLLDDDECEGGVTGDKLEEEYRWSSDDLLDDDECEGGVAGGELEEMNREEGELREMLHVNKEEEKKPVNDDVSVPRIKVLRRVIINNRGRTEAKAITMETQTNLDPMTTLEVRIRPQELLEEEGLPAKLMESTSSSNSPGVSSRALAISSDSCGPRIQQLISSMDSSLPVSNFITSSHDIFMIWRSTEQYGRTMQFGGQPYGAVNDHTPSMELAGHDPRSQLGSRNCEVTSTAASAANPSNVNKPLADRSAPELVEKMNFGRDGSSLKGKLLSQSVIMFKDKMSLQKRCNSFANEA
ncbi:hypothetical protein SESBI_34864, partial [Sesbania bispinosa]